MRTQAPGVRAAAVVGTALVAVALGGPRCAYSPTYTNTLCADREPRCPSGYLCDDTAGGRCVPVDARASADRASDTGVTGSGNAPAGTGGRPETSGSGGAGAAAPDGGATGGAASGGRSGGEAGTTGQAGASSGGMVGSGGVGAGGLPGTGGRTATGGMTVPGSGGTALGTGGLAATGGRTATGGAIATGGAASGGATSTGGAVATGGAASGGATSTGGAVGTGGAASGGASSGGAPGTGGAPECTAGQRRCASNTANQICGADQKWPLAQNCPLPAPPNPVCLNGYCAYHAGVDQAAASDALIVGYAYAVRFQVTAATKVFRLGMFATAAGAMVRLGLYSDSLVQLPDTLIASTAATPTANGAVEAPLSAATLLTAGKSYWVVAISSATLNIGFAASGPGFAFNNNGAGFPTLPTPFPAGASAPQPGSTPAFYAVLQDQ